MNPISIEKLDGGELSLNIPASLNEITFGQLIALRNPEKTGFEALSILTRVSVNELYGVRSYQELDQLAKNHLMLFDNSFTNGAINQLPRKLKVNSSGSNKTIKLKKYIAVEPVGAYTVVNKVISGEINAFIDLYGEDNWTDKFAPTLESCATVVNAFLYCKVTGKLWSKERPDFASNMSAADVLSLAKYFFNAYPQLSSYKPKNMAIAKIKAALNSLTQLKVVNKKAVVH